MCIRDSRYALYNLGAEYDAAEIFVFNSQNELLIATTYAKNGADYFDMESKNLITAMFPQFSKIGEGYYIDLFEDLGAKFPVKIVVYYSLGTVMDDYLFIIRLLGVTMLLGLVLFLSLIHI